MPRKPILTIRTRNSFLRCRASDEEIARVAKHADELGFRSASDYFRDLISRDLEKHKLPGLPQRDVGAPMNNKNKRGKKGSNQYSR